MNPDKKFIVDELLERVNASPFVLAVDYTGMTVLEFAELRGKLKDAGAECHVAKNTYMRTAIKEAGLPDIGDHLKGQTAFVTGENDVCAAAKAIKDFGKKANDKAKAVVGILDGDVLDKDQVNALADLPSRDQLLAQLLGVINEPATKLLRTINEPGGSLARVIKAKFDAAE